MISSAIILPILPAPALVPPGIPGTVGWLLLGPPEMSRNFKVREKLANFLHRATVFRLWVAAGSSEQDLLTAPPTGEWLQMDENSGLHWAVLGFRCPSVPAGTWQTPALRIWLFSFRTERLVLPFVQSWYSMALSDLPYSVPKQALLQTCLFSALCEELASAYSIQ